MPQKKDGPGLNWLIAAGIVGADIGTSVFYSTGVLFPMVGYLAPVCILFVCLMMWMFKVTYEEGLALSPYNGGAYSMILRSLGRQASVFAGALTIVSYLATAAVSAVSGAYYLSTLFGGLDKTSIVLLSFVPLVLFGLLNVRGIKEPAKLVTGVALFHFTLLLVIVVWGTTFLIFGDVDFSKMSKITIDGELTFAMLLHGLAAAFLGITGFESAAQIIEELKEPVNKTVRKLYFAVVVLVSLTAPTVSFLCLAILSEPEIVQGKDFLLASLADTLGGSALKTTIVIDAGLTLFAATNTAFVGFIGLSTTMAKQGNLPQFLLTRLAHKYPKIQGYPLISIPFMIVAIVMSAIVGGEVSILGKVYGMAFLGVMVSFCLGVVLMRNQPLRRDTPLQYLSTVLIQTKSRIIPLVPLISGAILFAAAVVLIFSSKAEATNMLIELTSIVLLIMAFYRWNALENRLEKRRDLRLGIGKFRSYSELPRNLSTFVLCAGGTGARKLINTTLRKLLKKTDGEPFELVIFHAEENKDKEGFFYELLQRVVSQQIAPIYSQDFIITLKILPGSFMEGLQTLKKTVDYNTLLIGSARSQRETNEVIENLQTELGVDVVNIDTLKT